MVGEEYEEYPIEDNEEDEAETQLEDQAEQQKEIYDEQAQEFQEKSDLYNLFWKVVESDDSSKVGNVKDAELGTLNITIRDCQKIALLADTLGHPGFAKFFRAQAEIVLSTSASKDGWLPELFVTQRKYSTKKKDMSANLPQFQPQKKKSILKWGS